MEDHAELWLNDLLVLAKLADQTHTLIAERNAEASSAAGNDEGA